MEEKVLIKSEQYSMKNFLLTMLAVGLLLSVILGCMLLTDSMSYYDDLFDEDYSETYYLHTRDGCDIRYGGKCYRCEAYEQGKFVYVADNFFSSYSFIYLLIPVVALALIGGLIYLWLHSYEMTITDKRVYGRTAFGKRVDLPMDSVSAVGSGWPKGITVSTSSGKIAFLMIKNRDEIHNWVSGLLIERQSKPVVASVSAPVVKQEAPASNADELKKFKELLDSGVITQEEFDAKKKQLLGL